MTELLKLFCTYDSSFGITFNVKFLPYIEVLLSGFSLEVCHSLQVSDGVELLGTLIFESAQHFDDFTTLSLTRLNIFRIYYQSQKIPK